jgi:2,3-bisphosphoglycerate-dependent phosphoglycerate mutase
LNTYYLVRHAHADWIADENQPVSERGQEDALLVADLLLDRPIDRIYSSPYRRAMQTISPLAQHLDLQITTIRDLRERRLGIISHA